MGCLGLHLDSCYAVPHGNFQRCSYSKQIYQVCRRTFWNVNHSFFMQEAIKGMVGEFSAPDGSNQSQSTFQFQWLYINGLLGFIFSMGVLYTALASRSVRSSLYGTGLSYGTYVLPFPLWLIQHNNY
ncbi:Boron transporter 4 [Zea mays]|uniref:Boron transporter 4 n=1 Tax=Zea mays TaxID=4577 RepID=A0A1D6PKN4_MAIZE|nr:Boron transporter 4 [Zea mays]